MGVGQGNAGVGGGGNRRGSLADNDCKASVQCTVWEQNADHAALRNIIHIY